METTEKKAIEEHLLKMCGYHPATPRYKLVQRLFNDEELLFQDVTYDKAVSLRKELWLLKFECGMRWNKIIVTDEAFFKYYVNAMGLTPTNHEEGTIFYDKDWDYN